MSWKSNLNEINGRGVEFLETDPLTCREGGGVMVFRFVQNFFFGQHKS